MRTLSLCLLWLALAACEGATTIPGEPGEPGKAGEPGRPGADGAEGPKGDRAPGGVSFCGFTAELFDGDDLGSYAAAADACLDVCDSDAAHVCTLHEALIVHQIEELDAMGWIATGADDCHGWSSADPDLEGRILRAESPTWAQPCDNYLSLACCR